MKIISHYSRDSYLKELYNQKELLAFVNGKEWFEEKLTEIWLAYYDHVKMPTKFQDVVMDVSKWEFYNL